MRNATACLQCRQTKRKCRASDVPGKCESCLQRGCECSLAGRITVQGPRSLGVKSNPEANQDDGVLSQLSRDQRLELIESYFELIHDRPHSLFHRATFIQDAIAQRVDTALLLSMCAMSSYLSSNDYLRALGPKMAAAARDRLLTNIGKPSIPNIQTAILLANICAAELDPEAEAMFFAVANRMSQIMRLDTVNNADGPIIQQIHIRIWWTLVMADYWSSAGLMIQRQLHHDSASVPLPGAEDIFQNAEPGQQELQISPPGLWAHMINLVRIFGLVLDLHQQLVKDILSHMDLERQVEDLARQLDNWAALLPSDVVFNEHNLQQHINRGIGGPFVALHLGFHHYCTLLFFHSLDQNRQHLPSAAGFSQRCRGHAFAFSRVLLASRNNSGCEAIYATVGQMIVVSSSVLLHTLLFGDDAELVEAKESLLGNFAALVQLRKFWPSLSVTIRRLFTFQSACQQPESNSTHRIDQWMFQFLYQHSTSLDDRPSSPAATSAESKRSAILASMSSYKVAHEREAAFNYALDTLGY